MGKFKHKINTFSLWSYKTNFKKYGVMSPFLERVLLVILWCIKALVSVMFDFFLILEEERVRETETASVPLGSWGSAHRDSHNWLQSESRQSGARV